MSTPSEKHPPAPDAPSPGARRSRGALRMERVYRALAAHRSRAVLTAGAVLLCAWAFTFSSMTVGLYAVQAASFYHQQSAVLATAAIASGVLGAVAKPFFARVADAASRQAAYLVVVGLYVGGYVLAAASGNVGMYVAGSVMVSVGDAGLLITNDIVVADLTPLEWRGYASAMLATPYLVNFWFTGKVVDALNGNWRWGYGMFGVVMPAALLVSVLLLSRLETLSGESGLPGRDEPPISPEKSYRNPLLLLSSFFGVDDLLLLGLGLACCLILLPFSLNGFWEGGWRNASIIAMLSTGCILLAVIATLKLRYSFVTGWRLLSNRTFLIIVFVQSIYMVASNIRGVYWSTYVLVAKPWSLQNWTYYSNIPLLSSTLAGLVVGVLQRVTHRYKFILVVGLLLKVLGIGLLLNGNLATLETSALVVGVMICGIADATESVCCRVAAQASVSHDDVAHALAIYALWPKIANAVGAAIVGTIWAQCLPPSLRAALPQDTPDDEIATIFGDPTYLRSLDIEAEVRSASIFAYRGVLFYCLIVAMSLTIVPLLVVYFVSDYFFGKQQNAVDDLGNDGNPTRGRIDG